MSQEAKMILQISLQGAERVRKRQLIAFEVLLCAVVGVLLWIGHLSQSGADIRSILVWSVVATIFAVIYGAVALAMYINSTARGILKAIELLAKE